MFISPCLWCKHFDSTAHEKHIGWRCRAFPEGLPPEINSGGGFLHTEPYPGDNGIQFERQDDDKLTPSLANILEVSLMDSPTLLQMMIDMVVEGVNWDYYRRRYLTKWDKQMTEAYHPICMWCKHLDVNDEDLKRCAAFPDGIPQEIRSLGTVLHTEPYEGDHGIQFEKQPDHSQMPERFRFFVDHISSYDSETLLRMAMDKTREQENWHNDPEKYPMISDMRANE